MRKRRCLEELWEFKFYRINRITLFSICIQWFSHVNMNTLGVAWAPTLFIDIVGGKSPLVDDEFMNWWIFRVLNLKNQMIQLFREATDGILNGQSRFDENFTFHTEHSSSIKLPVRREWKVRGLSSLSFHSCITSQQSTSNAERQLNVSIYMRH